MFNELQKKQNMAKDISHCHEADNVQRDYTACRAERKNEINIAANCRNNPESFFNYINNKKEIRSRTGPLSDSHSKLVTQKLNIQTC